MIARIKKWLLEARPRARRHWLDWGASYLCLLLFLLLLADFALRV